MFSGPPNSTRRSDTGRAIAREMADSCLAMRVRKLDRIVNRAYTAALSPLGITQAQLNLLVAIELSAPVSAAAIGQMLELEKSTLSRNLSRLTANGWIGRGPALRLTAKGRAVLVDAKPLWSAVQKRLRSALGADASLALARMSARARSTLLE